MQETSRQEITEGKMKLYRVTDEYQKAELRAYLIDDPEIDCIDLEPIEITEGEIADIIHGMPYEREYSDAKDASKAILSKLSGQ